MDNREVFARNLRSARSNAGLSQKELAHRSGVDRTYISSPERSIHPAGIDVIDALAEVLGTTAAKLLERVE